MRHDLRKMVAVLGMTCACAAAAQTQLRVPPEYERDGGPYVPTPNVVVDRMLGMANVGASDYVIDLGSAMASSCSRRPTSSSPAATASISTRS